MTFYTHSVFGVFLSVVLLELLNFTGLVGIYLFGSAALKFFIGAILGALVPDLDHRSSKLSRLLPFLSWFVKRLRIRHRGFTHSFLGVLLVSLILSIIAVLGLGNELLIYGILIGYVSHVFIDLFNPDGVFLFFPSDRRYSFANIKVGSRSENLVLFILGLVLILIVYYESGSLDSLDYFLGLLRRNI
ncbi:MAG: putative membrane-bound metal-dependent hydrolase [Candidatus Frackibacter sp. T328-2]|nr:MAG: putative membrane-bound metal-dependent hydrolase [Candidatus Frackibacter sp. T328-2]